MPLIEVTGKSSDPAYLAAYISETMGEFIAIMKREKEREWQNTSQNKALIAATKLFRQYTKELEDLKGQLKQSADNGAPAGALAALQAQIEEKEQEIERVRGSVPAEPDMTVGPTFGIWESPKPEPFKHGMDPYSLVIHHPWRALVSLSFAWLLAVLLLPLRRTTPPEDPMPRPTEA
jgi:hypothetical protein